MLFEHLFNPGNLTPHIIRMTSAGDAAGSLPTAPAFKLPGVNLFASGFYRGQQWPASRVQGIADNIRKNGPSGTKLLIPPAVMGHEEDQKWLDDTSLPAAGWVDPDSVETIPDPDHPGELILRGDVVNVPPEVAAKIKSGEFANGSGEFYELSDDFGKSQGFTMRRFGLLGGEVPQVKRLGRLPMPVPMTELKVFAEVVAAPKGGAAFILAFAERQTMDRNAAYTAIKAVMPGLSQATLDSLNDDQLNEFVANLPAPAPAPVVPAPMAEATPEEMTAALVAAGQDQATVAAMPPADLKAAYDLVKGATPMAEEEKKEEEKKAEGEVAKMSEGQKAIAKQLADSKKSVAELHRFTEQLKRDAKSAQIEPVCEALVKSGLTPAFVNEWVKPQLIALDNTHAIHRFTENGTVKSGTAFQAKIAAAKALNPAKCFVAFGEKVPGGGDTSTPAAQKAAAIEKAKEHAATVPNDAWSQTSFKSQAGFVQKFSEAFDKNPVAALSMLPAV
jgi:hypothetical protein